MNAERVAQRALELHEKASMPLSEALTLALREAAPGPIWPIARLFIDSGGNVCGDSHLYAPGLSEGEHDVYPLPVNANAEPFWCEQTETWLYKDESRKAFKNRPLDPQPPRPSQRFMVASIKHKAGIVTLVTINAEDVLPPLESGQEVTLSPHGVMASGELAGLPVEIDRTNAPKAQRSAFEVAMRELHPEWTFTRDPVFDYHNERTRCAWEGWKAALGVLVGAKDQPAGGPDA